MYNFTLICADTDSFTICKPNGDPFSKEETDKLTEQLNSLYPTGINWEFEFNYPKMMVLKPKNYIMVDEKGKRKLKGSSLKSSTMEPALKNMLNEFIEALLEERNDDLPIIYDKYIQLALNITDIKPWCTKKTLSPTTYKSERKNETDIVDAVRGTEYKSGDRVYLFAMTETIELDEFYKAGAKKGQRKTKKVKVYGLQENFKGVYDRQCYVDKVLATTKRFSTVIDTSIFKKYTVGEVV